MYTTELWVFAGGLTPRGGHVPLCCLLRAYCTCFRYHLGSMVVGGLVVGVAQPFRITFGVVAFIVEFERNSSGILSCLCDCCVSAYFTHLEPYCRNAYMDLALNARCFQESAWHASMVNAEFMATATWQFNTLCYCRELHTVPVHIIPRPPKTQIRLACARTLQCRGRPFFGAGET